MTRKYCSGRCREAARRKRSRSENIGNNVRWQLDKQRQENADLSVTNDRLTQALNRQKNANRRMQTTLANRDAYIQGQAEKIAAARRRASQLLIERDEARREADRSIVDPDKYEELLKNFQSLETAHRSLQERYDDIAEALEGAAQEREFFRQVVRSWDRLCNVLYKQVKGDPRSEKDRETLQLWTRFREQVGRPVKPIRKETI